MNSFRTAGLAALFAAGLGCATPPPPFEIREPAGLDQLETVVQEQWRTTRERAESTGELGGLCRWYHAYRELSLASSCYQAQLARNVTPETTYLLAHVERELGQPELAARRFAEVPRKHRLGAIAALWRARQLEEQGLLIEAHRVLAELLAGRPLDLRAQADLARIEIAEGQPGAALERLDQVRTWALDHPELQTLRAAAERTLGHGDAAPPSRDDRRIPLDDPTLAGLDELRVGAKPWSDRALKLVAAGRTEAALELYRLALASQPDWVFLRLRVGEALERAGRFDAAWSQYEVATTLEPSNPAPYTKIARLALRRGRVQEAEAASRRALELDPADVENLGRLTGLLLRRSSPEALSLITRAVTLRPDRLDLRRLRTAAAVMFDPRTREDDLIDFPDDPELRRLVALAALRRGQVDRALGLLDRTSGCRQQAEVRAVALVRSGRRDEALQLARDRGLQDLARLLEAGRMPELPALLPLCQENAANESEGGES